MTHGSNKKPGDPSPGRRGRRRGPDTILASRGRDRSEGLKKKTLCQESTLVVGGWLWRAEREQASQRQTEVHTGSRGASRREERVSTPELGEGASLCCLIPAVPREGRESVLLLLDCEFLSRTSCRKALPRNRMHKKQGIVHEHILPARSLQKSCVPEGSQSELQALSYT